MKTTAKSNPVPAIIPLPESIMQCAGSFVLDASTRLVTGASASAAAAAFADAIRPATGFIAQVATDMPAEGNAIAFVLDTARTDLGDEGYELEVTSSRATLVAPTQAGLFYAVQTLRQLLPPEILSPDPVEGVVWSIPCVAIRDRPRFAWRGLMLDTGHDFQRLSYVFRFIDLMALYKFNVFHWHICDLGIFPLEIRGYPELQNPAHRGPRLRGEPPRPVKHGFFTQNEARAVVAYAAARHITVLPEIDMPGHATPVLTAYPEFDCPVPHTQYGLDRWEYCLSSEPAMRFLEAALTQIMAIFPSPFIHIGGDECPPDHWKTCPSCQAKIKAEGLKDEEDLRRSFLLRIERFLGARGRRMIGWDEIYENGVGRSTALMAWRPKVALEVAATAAGHEVVMTPPSHVYFDYSEEKTPIDKVYAYEPVGAALSPEQAAHVLGAQAQLWSDNHPTEAEIDRLTYPRACALAEVVWSPASSRDWGSFAERLTAHARRLAQFGIKIPACPRSGE